MFTGIVQEVGRVVAREEGEGTLRFRVRCPELGGGLEEGESIAVDGVCQTVTGFDEDGFTFRAGEATLARTTAAGWTDGRRLNLERALTLADRLGGHLVQGHVDGTGTIRAVEREGENVRISVELPVEVAEVTVARGSLAVDGVSLTVAELREEVAEVAVIPYTWAHTNLDRLREGSAVNLEADLMAKYAARLLAPYRREPPSDAEG